MKPKVLQVLSLILVVTAAIAAYGDKIATVSFLPPKIAQLWPFILVASTALNRIALLIGDLLDDWKLNDSFKVLALTGFLWAALSCSGCAWLKQPATQVKLQQTGTWLLSKAEQIAVGTIISAAQSQADAGKKADWLDGFAGNLWAQTSASFSSADLKALAAIWTPDKPHWADLATQLAAIFDKASNLPADLRIQLIAEALNQAAATARQMPASAFAAPLEPVDTPRLVEAPSLSPLFYAGQVVYPRVFFTDAEK